MEVLRKKMKRMKRMIMRRPPKMAETRKITRPMKNMFRDRPHTPGAKPLLHLPIYPGSARLLGPQGGTPLRPLKSVPGSLWAPEPVPSPTCSRWALFPVEGILLTHFILTLFIPLDLFKFSLQSFQPTEERCPRER